MKPNLSSVGKPALVVTLALLLLGCMGEVNKAGSNTAAPTESNSTDAAAAPAKSTTESPPSGTMMAATSAPKVTLDPELQKVVDMALAGLGDEALLAYIDKSTDTFTLDTEQILYLNDIGMSSPVIAALIRHGEGEPAAESDTAVAKEDAAESAETTEAKSAPAAESAPAPVAQTAPIEQTAPAPPPQGQVTYNYNYYYDTLSPYGTWYTHPDYGWCWQPTVAVIDVGWRPYCHRGRWLYTNCGWYWNSDYSWGWAPFHYGRWFDRGGSWFWVPGYTWGPSWVCWRNWDSYCGWAPLPPSCSWSPGIGFTFYGSRVGVGFGFNLGHSMFTFVSWNRFCDPHPWRHRAPTTQVVNIYNNSTVINNYSRGRHGVIVNEGFGRDRIAAVTGKPVRQVILQDVAAHGGRYKPGRLDDRSTTLAVYRPEIRDHRAPGSGGKEPQIARPPSGVALKPWTSAKLPAPAAAKPLRLEPGELPGANGTAVAAGKGEGNTSAFRGTVYGRANERRAVPPEVASLNKPTTPARSSPVRPSTSVPTRETKPLNPGLNPAPGRATDSGSKPILEQPRRSFDTTKPQTRSTPSTTQLPKPNGRVERPALPNTPRQEVRTQPAPITRDYAPKPVTVNPNVSRPAYSAPQPGVPNVQSRPQPATPAYQKPPTPSYSAPAPSYSPPAPRPAAPSYSPPAQSYSRPAPAPSSKPSPSSGGSNRPGGKDR